MIVTLFIGLVIGGFGGLTAGCLASAAKEADRSMETIMKNEMSSDNKSD
ncbi:MAG: DUF3789 domain-containing protein [Oscillospiraceae bacterium]